MTTTTSTQISKSEIFTVYNQMRAFARRHGNTKMIERLNKALGILQSKNYYQAEKAAYEPTTHTCGCPDWKYRFAKNRQYTGACKHMLAEIMLEQIKLNRSLYK